MGGSGRHRHRHRRETPDARFDASYRSSTFAKVKSDNGGVTADKREFFSEPMTSVVQGRDSWKVRSRVCEITEFSLENGTGTIDLYPSCSVYFSLSPPPLIPKSAKYFATFAREEKVRICERYPLCSRHETGRLIHVYVHHTSLMFIRISYALHKYDLYTGYTIIFIVFKQINC